VVSLQIFVPIKLAFVVFECTVKHFIDLSLNFEVIFVESHYVVSASLA